MLKDQRWFKIRLFLGHPDRITRNCLLEFSQLGSVITTRKQEEN